MQQRIINWAADAAVVIVGLGVIAYFVAMVVYFVAADSAPQLTAWFMSAPAQNIGIPCSAMASFVIVKLLWTAVPPGTSTDGLKFKAFGLEFSGPSGPITLWLLCFLTFVSALKLLR
jgi:hypothetical protein